MQADFDRPLGYPQAPGDRRLREIGKVSKTDQFLLAGCEPRERALHVEPLEDGALVTLIGGLVELGHRLRSASALEPDGLVVDDPREPSTELLVASKR